MQFSSPALRTPPSALALPFVALLTDGSVVTATDVAARIDEGAGIVTATVVGGQVWVVTGCGELRRYAADGKELAAPVPLAELAGEVTIVGVHRGPRAALIESDSWCAVIRECADGSCAVEELGVRTADRRILVGARAAERRRASIRLGQLELAIPADLASARIGASAVTLDGSLLLVELVGATSSTVVLYSLRQGKLHARIRIGESRVVAAADRAGLIVLARGEHIALLDLREGRCTAERILTSPVVACAIDDAGATVAIVDAAGHTIRLGRALTDVDGAAGEMVVVDAPVEDADVASPPANDEPAPVAEIVASEAPVEVAPPAEKGTLSAYLHALGAPRAEPLTREELAGYLTDAHAWIEAACAVAVATRGSDASALTTAREREHAAAERYMGWGRRGAPHVELAHELDLSPMAATVLLLIAAPQIWCDLARDYAAAAADSSRPLVDEVLIATLLQAGIEQQSALARELDVDAPLVKSGAVVIAPGVRPFVALSAHPSIARRLVGATLDSSSRTVLDFADFIGPREDVVALAAVLEEPRSAPARIALRGKPGSGRRTVAAMLAACAGREVDTVLANAPELAQRLRDVTLRGHVPVVDLDRVSADDEARWSAIRTALDGHAGPLFVRAERESDLPFTPTDSIDFPMLTETERAACWRLHLDDASRADALAERYAIGPGAIARAAAAPDPIAALRASRGHRVARLAERVDRLATWDDLVVTDDVGDALRELVARVRYRRTVLETWGMGDVATTARGVTALFQGGPGTGKTMAAGVIARALGYELWRVDLSKVVSKWIGETERNLSQLFDAAEEGEIVLLFDEADSLFTKRTEVKSSNDKHANAATNYLLQRIDSFTGIAILTTNFGTAIDTAFRRRLAVHVEFPFPDADERLRLWTAHLPRALPTRGDLGLRELAETYELSGGYIRNVALRAAYLAAGRADAPAITADDLRRAIKLEKERVGKLGNGRIE
jgi:DNA replication protein DnaC